MHLHLPIFVLLILNNEILNLNVTLIKCFKTVNTGNDCVEMASVEDGDRYVPKLTTGKAAGSDVITAGSDVITGGSDGITGGSDGITAGSDGITAGSDGMLLAVMV